MKVELYVERHLETSGWKCLFRNVRVMGVQVDLILRNSTGVLTLVEVKTQGRSQLATLSQTQRGRLFRAASFLSQFEAVELVFALVEGLRVDLLPVDAIDT